MTSHYNPSNGCYESQHPAKGGDLHRTRIKWRCIKFLFKTVYFVLEGKGRLNLVTDATDFPLEKRKKGQKNKREQH